MPLCYARNDIYSCQNLNAWPLSIHLRVMSWNDSYSLASFFDGWDALLLWIGRYHVPVTRLLYITRLVIPFLIILVRYFILGSFSPSFSRYICIGLFLVQVILSYSVYLSMYYIVYLAWFYTDFILFSLPSFLFTIYKHMYFSFRCLF